MTCRDFDLFLSGDNLPPAARKHWQQCAACRILHASIRSENVPGELQDQITNRILADLQPVSSLPARAVLTMQLMMLAVIAIAVGVWYYGLAGWAERSRGQMAVMFSLLGTAVLVASDQLTRMMIPGAKVMMQPWIAIGLPLTTLQIAVFLLFPYESDPDFFSTGLHCWIVGMVCAGLTAPLVVWVMRRGAGVSRIWQGATAGLLCGLAGAAVLEFACPFLERTHITSWHLGAVLTSALTGVIASECFIEIRRRTSA